jgi:hypothetical protein
MTPARIDHLTIIAPSLALGIAFVAEALGVEPGPGGDHPRMGTHNRLLRLGDDCYLEVIAVNPAAPPPARPRWFGLDGLAPDAPPRLAAWVAGIDDIGSAASLQALTGPPEPMTRGALHWQITVRSDGALAEGGTVPGLIEWPAGVHPAPALPDLGCRLVQLQLRHPDPARLRDLLSPLVLDERVVIEPLPPGTAPVLVTYIDTPAGRRTLGLRTSF